MAESFELNPGNPSKWSLLQIGTVCLLSPLGYCGFTSLPFYVYSHTGLFFFSFYTLLVLICMPVCYVQIKLGALHRKGALAIFSRLVPILKGVASSLLLMTYLRSLTHALEISYGLYYMFASLQQPFPWGARVDANVSSQEAKITIFDNIKTTPEDSYFVNDFLQRSLHIGSWGPLVWYLVLCVLSVWLFVYFIIIKGSTGFVKVMNVLVPVSLGLLLMLLVYAYSAIPQASSSVYSFFTHVTTSTTAVTHVSFTELLSRPKIWLDALETHVYGLGLWAGTLPFLGAHVTCRKKVINTTWLTLLTLYSIVPHLMLITLMPYIDPECPGGTLGYEIGIKPGMSFLFIAVPHTFTKYQLSPFMAFSLYLTFVLISLQHLSLNLLMIWENVWPSIPKVVIGYFRRIPCLLAVFCFLSFLLTTPYASECGIYLYQIIRFYVDRLLFALIIFSMVPFVIGFVRQETLRTPIDRIFMAVWYSLASVLAACLLLYNFVVFVYPEAVVSYEQRWAEHLGWCVSITPLLVGVLLGALHTLCTRDGTLRQRLLGSVRSGGSMSTDTGDDCLSVGTGDTDLKTPCPSRHPTPLTQARAPLLQHSSPLMDKSNASNQHTLFPVNPMSLPLKTAVAQGATATPNINSPTAGREVFPPETSSLNYGTLQVQGRRNKAEVEVVMRSTSAGNVARL